MLDRAGNANRDIDFRSDNLAGLANLIIIGDIARVHRSARRADSGTQLVRQREDDLLEGFGVLERTTTRDDDLGRGQFRTFQLGDFCADEAG